MCSPGAIAERSPSGDSRIIETENVLHLQAVDGDAEMLKKQVEKLEGNILTLNEQLEAARKEAKTLKAESKASAALESVLRKEQARAEVILPT